MAEFVKIEDIRELPDPQRTYKWNLIIDKFPGGLGEATPLNIRCASAGTPARTIEPIEINSHGHKVKWHGAAQYAGTMDLTVYETQDLYVQNFLWAWQEKHWKTNEGHQTVKKDLETKVTLQLLDAGNAGLKKYIMIGCWIEGVTSYELTAESGGVQMSFSLSWDYFTYE